uniref:Uncharacterized protein n=1 Tax=Caenorhabditis japonica TaxID=281687 RepID=A0A8R1IEZ1_CAEJA
MARKRKNSDSDHGGDDKSAAYKRTNGCEILMLSLVCFLMIVGLIVAIPLIMMAKGPIDNDYMANKLRIVKGK